MTRRRKVEDEFPDNQDKKAIMAKVAEDADANTKKGGD
jgi:hypothetical protein